LLFVSSLAFIFRSRRTNRQSLFFCLFVLRLLMPRYGNSKSFPAVPVCGVWQTAVVFF
jgi:hypothetical protein